MCKFQIAVDTKTAADVEEAKMRFAAMPGIVSSVSVTEDNRSVVAEAEVPGMKGDKLMITGWAKDRFGMHRTMNPTVQILA